MSMNKFLALERDEEGNVPTVGQFTAYDPAVFTKIIDEHAQLMSSYTGYPPSYFGQTSTANPASADAIRVAENGLVRRAEQCQHQWSGPLEDIMRLIWRFANGGAEVPAEMQRLETDWEPATTLTPAGTTDAILKQVQMGAIPPTSDVTLKQLGYSGVERQRLEIDRAVDQGASVLAQLSQSLQAKQIRGNTSIEHVINPPNAAKMSSPQQPPPDPQAAQAGLAILVGLAIAKLWPSLDLLHLRESLPAFKAAVTREVQQHAQASATMAARQYRLQRVAAGAGAGFTPRPAAASPVGAGRGDVDYAVQPLWSAEVLAEPVTEAGSSAIADAKARLAAASERLVLDAGRDTIVSNVQATGRRRAGLGCPSRAPATSALMLATRGAVYKCRSTSPTTQASRVRAFEVHDNCRCHVEPVFTAYEPSARRGGRRRRCGATNGAASPGTRHVSRSGRP
jgi:hypothetical protein